MNFAILQPPAKVFSMKCFLPTDPQKLSPSKVSHYNYGTLKCILGQAHIIIYLELPPGVEYFLL